MTGDAPSFLEVREYRRWRLMQISVPRPNSIAAACRLAWGLDIFVGWFPLLKVMLACDAAIVWWLR